MSVYGTVNYMEPHKMLFSYYHMKSKCFWYANIMDKLNQNQIDLKQDIHFWGMPKLY